MGAIAFLWVVAIVDAARGIPSIPSLDDIEPLGDADCPSVSVLFAARDEARKLPAALESFLGLDYPQYEIVGVNDRSTDATGEILQSAAAGRARMKYVCVTELPSGWLGKPHALQKAYEQSSGDWLVFTDADVRFEPGVLRSTIALAQKRGWEHLTLSARTEVFTFGEKIAMTFFGLAFLMSLRPWRVSDPQAGEFAGIGAFQLVRRSAYETMGTHRRLAMEVVDDMKLGKLAKEAGFLSGIANAEEAVSVHWQDGVENIIRGTTKNFFAFSGYSLATVGWQIFGLLAMCVAPWAALPFVRGWALVFAGIAVGLAIAMDIGACMEFKISPLYALTFPIGAVIFVWMLARSTIVTLWSGGITWRGTFYRLEELRRGLV